MLDLTLIICTYNRAAMLDDALLSFAGCRRVTDFSFEVIVVDNNSTDNTAAICQYWQQQADIPLHYLLEARQGCSHARNCAVQHARGKWLWFTDDDVRFEAGWLEAVCRAIRLYPQAAAIAGHIELDFEQPAPDWLPDIARNYYGQTRFGGNSRLLARNEFPISANAGFRRDVFAELGNFRADLGRQYASLISWDETELALRIQQAGYRMAYVHDAIVWHRVPVTRLSREWLYRRVFADGISECRAMYVSSGPLLYISIIGDRLQRILKRILNGQLSLSDRLWMARRAGVIYQCLLNLLPFRSA